MCGARLAVAGGWALLRTRAAPRRRAATPPLEPPHSTAPPPPPAHGLHVIVLVARRGVHAGVHRLGRCSAIERRRGRRRRLVAQRPRAALRGAGTGGEDAQAEGAVRAARCEAWSGQEAAGDAKHRSDRQHGAGGASLTAVAGWKQARLVLKEHMVEGAATAAAVRRRAGRRARSCRCGRMLCTLCCPAFGKALANCFTGCAQGIARCRWYSTGRGADRGCGRPQEAPARVNVHSTRGRNAQRATQTNQDARCAAARGGSRCKQLGKGWTFKRIEGW